MKNTLLRSKGFYFLLALLVAALFFTGVFAASIGTGNLSILSGSSTNDGKAADISYPGDAFVIIEGKAQKIRGIRVCNVDMGNASFRDRIEIRAMLLDPQDMGQVLNNPNSWIEIVVAYEVSSGEDFILSNGKKVKVATLRESVDNHMTRNNGDIQFMPQMGGTSIDLDTYYILGSIMVLGGAPPGQQDNLNSLTIICDAGL